MRIEAGRHLRLAWGFFGGQFVERLCEARQAVGRQLEDVAFRQLDDFGRRARGVAVEADECLAIALSISSTMSFISAPYPIRREQRGSLLH